MKNEVNVDLDLRSRIDRLLAAKRFNHSYFGRKPKGKIDCGRYFIQKIPVSFGTLAYHARMGKHLNFCDKYEVCAATGGRWTRTTLIATISAAIFLLLTRLSVI